MSDVTLYWQQLTKAHETQAKAHRRYAEALRTSGRTDELTLTAISHNDTQAGYFDKRADEARSHAEWTAESTTCTEA